jgi:hypothetical protein
MYSGAMSEWNYTKCAKPFESEEEALGYLQDKDFAGYVLKRDHGYAAVCPTYPDGYYPDAVVVAEVENSKRELAAEKKSLPVQSCC